MSSEFDRDARTEQLATRAAADAAMEPGGQRAPEQPRRDVSTLRDDERREVGMLAQGLPALQSQLHELTVLLDQNASEVGNQRSRYDAAQQALDKLERGGGYTREQYQQAVEGYHQAHVRLLTAQHEHELLQSKLDLVRQLVDVARFTLTLIERIEPGVVDRAALERPPEPSGRPPAAEVAPPAVASPLHTPDQEAAIVAAQEEERVAIATQLRTGPAETLTNLILRAEICERLVHTDPAAARSELVDLRETVRRSLQDVLLFIADVRPPLLDTLGLFPALRRFADDWRAMGQTPLKIGLIGQERRFAPAREIAVFRIVQDAVKAAAGRGGDAPLELQVALEERLVRVTLPIPSASPLPASDGPTPFPPEYESLRHRATVVGGSAVFDERGPRPVISVVIPLDGPTDPGRLAAGDVG